MFLHRVFRLNPFTQHSTPYLPEIRMADSGTVGSYPELSGTQFYSPGPPRWGSPQASWDTRSTLRPKQRARNCYTGPAREAVGGIWGITGVPNVQPHGHLCKPLATFCAPGGDRLPDCSTTTSRSPRHGPLGHGHLFFTLPGPVGAPREIPSQAQFELLEADPQDQLE